MANSDADVVWIQICYFVEFEKNDKGFWTRKFVGDDEENITAILVRKSILYDELYKKVVEELKIDSMLYELEMRCENPIRSDYPEPPFKIDCDNRVRWLMSYFDRTKLSITLKRKAFEIQEPYVVKSCASAECLEGSHNVVIDDNGSDAYGLGRESLESHRVEKSHNIAIDGNGRDAYGIGGESLESHGLEESHNIAIEDYNAGLGGKSPQSGVVGVDPLLSSLGEDVVLNVCQSSFNNRNDDVLDNEEDDTHNLHDVDDIFNHDISDDKDYMDISDDGNVEEDAREKTPIGDTLDDINNRLNSHEAPLLQSFGSLDLIRSNPDSRHMSSLRIPESLDIKENELFASKGHLIQKLEMMALKCHFEFIPQTSTRSIYVAHCAVEQCGWRVRATKVNMSDPESCSSETFQVRIYEVFGRKVLAPLVDKNQSGRPSSTKRKKSAGERRSKKCSRCNKDVGHDCRTCSSLVASVPSLPA